MWLDLDDPIDVTQRKIVGSTFSRFPVARGSLDDVVGIVQAKDLLAESLKGRALILRDILHTPIFIPESTPAFYVLELLRKSNVQMALVIDEFGGFQGLVTLFDILESIVGEIPETGELVDREIIQREDGSWLVDGMLPIDEFKDIFHINELPDEERGYYQTVGGFVMSYLGHIPKASDFFDWAGMRFEVVDMDGMRIDKIMIIPSSIAGDQ
jgi:putative hemolysin